MASISTSLAAYHYAGSSAADRILEFKWSLPSAEKDLNALQAQTAYPDRQGIAAARSTRRKLKDKGGGRAELRIAQAKWADLTSQGDVAREQGSMLTAEREVAASCEVTTTGNLRALEVTCSSLSRDIITSRLCANCKAGSVLEGGVLRSVFDGRYLCYSEEMGKGPLLVVCLQSAKR